MVGLRFNRLTVLSQNGTTKCGSKKWECQCDCGNFKTIRQGDLHSGHTKSCGCLHKEVARDRHSTHSMAGTSIYNVWIGMDKRCGDKHIKNYGSRGISVCVPWLESFETFYKDMGDIPFHGAQIDRINNDGDYEPNNCRWVTAKENSRNRRSNHIITYNDETMCLEDWSEKLGISSDVLGGRINRRGWTIERAFTTPTNHQ